MITPRILTSSPKGMMSCAGTFLLIIVSFQVLTNGCSRPVQSALPHMRPLTDRVFERTAARVERGKYLTEGILQCFVCHSERDWDSPGAPPVPGRKGAGSIVWSDSIFVLPAPNITPDIETGAGTWTDDMLARAIREGIGHDGRALSGPMWYWAFSNLTDEDLASVVVYLRTLAPVRNVLPKRRLPPEDEEAIKKGPKPITEPRPGQNTPGPVERGRYLVEIADCAGCHSAWEAPFNPGIFGGGNLIERLTPHGKIHRFSANLTQDPSGIAYYDDSLFIEVIRTGRVRAREIDPVMPWTVFRHMNDGDLRAIFAFLKTVRHVRHTIDNAIAPSYCPMCGQEHGEGVYNISKFETFTPMIVDSFQLDRYIGEYASEFLTVTFVREGKKFIGVADGRRMEFVQGADSLFYAKEWPGPISFEVDARDRVVSLLSHEVEDYRAIKK